MFSFVLPQIQSGKGDVTITNDGATILKEMKLVHPAAKMVNSYSSYAETQEYDDDSSFQL